MTDITARISQYAAQLRFEDLDGQTLEQVRLFIADYYAACFAGFRINEAVNQKLIRYMEEKGGAAQSQVLFLGRKLPETSAAFINALFAHGADMDDGNRKSAGHIATHVMPAVFAMADTLPNVTWKDVFTAIVVGYDVFNRVAGAAQPSLYAKGFHSTGIGGGIACAAACSKLLGLDAEGIYNAISLAALQASGLIIIDESGQGCKPINPANAARIGLESARWAAMGLDAPRQPLESKKGWFNAFADEIDEKTLLDNLGQVYTINESYLKLYPACRHTHCAIDAAIAIRQQMAADGLTAEDIESINIRIYPNAIRSTGHILYPATADEAKFSLSYCTAAALEKGEFGLRELNVESCQKTQLLVPLINITPDPALENRVLGIRGASVCIRAGGKCYEQNIATPKGEGDQRLSWEDLTVKFRQCAAGMADSDQIRSIVEALCHLDPAQAYAPILH